MAFLKRFFTGVTENDVPFFADIGTDGDNLFTDDLDHQKVKVKLTSTTQDPFEFKTTGEYNRESGHTGGKVEFKYKDPTYGATYTESWDLENSINTRLEFEKTVRNRPLNIEVGAGLIPVQDTNFAADGTIKYSHHNAAVASCGKYKNNEFLSDHSIVLGKSGLFIGGRVGVNVSTKQVESKELTMGMSGKSHQVTIAMSDNLDKLKTTIFHEVNPTFSYGVKAQHVFSENTSALAGAFKYALNDISTIRGTLNNCGSLGLSFRHAIRPSVSLVFNSEFDMLNFSAGNHRSGLSIELTP
ncbi:hypothetical protein LOD99_1066 [Oopsacas minuta]|uniref:Uncharacterized protein n=1 Tax=Oopsacas minuta TaxID=111878 RepID=A0AAV7K0I7_9METZ|nr:hypothetical protein LOD99_1066 [Oopsacas minuta]